MSSQSKVFADLLAMSSRASFKPHESVYMGTKVFEEMRRAMSLESPYDLNSDPPPPTYMGLKVYIVSNDPHHLRFV